MKIKKTVLHLTGIIIFLLTVQFGLYACPKCNQDFYKELLGERGNTLGGQELLQAIRNQSVSGEPSNLVLPATYNAQTDIKQSIITETPEPAEISYVPFVFIFVQLMFFNT